MNAMERNLQQVPKEPPVFDARVLLDGSDTAQIRLDGQTYILRLTRAGKLILTK